MVDLTFVLRELHGLMVAGSHGAATAATATAGAGGSLVCPNPNGRICVVNTDNVPNNGRVIRGHVLDVARRERGAASSSSAAAAAADSDTGAVNDNEDDAFITFLKTRVAFLDTMVDRITSQRDGSDGLVPRCEPVPSKALVVQDIHGDLPPALLHESIRKRRGVVVRTKPGQLDADVALKLRIANGTHTAAAQCMALCGMSKTDALSSSSSSSSDGSAGAGAEGRDGGLVMEYLDSLFETQVLPGAVSDDSIRCDEGDVRAAWDDWRRRLSHPHFGLSTFFITQNCAAKGGIRLGPTIRSLLFRRGAGGQTGEGGGVSVSVSMAFALASILRFVTPTTKNGQDSDGDGDCLMMESSGSVGAATSKIYRGWLDGGLDRRKGNDDSGGVGEHDDVSAAVEYADGLRYNLDDGWYEFRCDCYVQAPNSIAASYEGGMRIALPVLLGRLSAPSAQQRQPISYRPAVEAYLKSKEGGDLADVASRQNKDADCGFEDLVDAVSTLYARMVAGDGILDLLLEMRSKSGVYHDGFSTGCSVLVDFDASASPALSFGLQQRRRRRRLQCDGHSPLWYRPSPIPDVSALLDFGIGNDWDGIAMVVFGEVSSAKTIDLHTHLLPPSHEPLCSWGIDELLTYHYLVAEYFMMAPPHITPESFYALTKREQAELIWKALFLDRTPISEACRGVVTTLVALGLEEAVKNRDLLAIRKFYDSFRTDGVDGAERFSRLACDIAGVKYAVMTNVPFDANEARHWKPIPKEYPSQYRSALRVDPLLAGDVDAVNAALSESGYETTLEGARRYLRDWCDLMKPEYMMASTPHDFSVPHRPALLREVEGDTHGTHAGMARRTAHANEGDATNSAVPRSCDDVDDGEAATAIDERSDLLSDVLMKVCEERDLPVALKIGAHRGINPSLENAGDGVVAFADAGVLARLCSRYPKVRFLATFLSRNNQHEACVLASKFRNLHLYGCWWYCNNPSLVEDITKMRVEMLGFAFTAQHSDARVLDQLMYKWPHSRAVIAAVLVGEYSKLAAAGWIPTRAEVRRDVERLFGKSYEEFMSKSLK